MAYFADLTPYVYGIGERPDGPQALNIGWLDRRCPFPTGETPAEFREKLRLFCLDAVLVRLYRGFHPCEFCPLTDDEWAAGREDRCGEGASLAAIGCGEMRVEGETAVYAAPSLIVHYVEAHHYRPPDPFIEAVLHGPQPGSARHEALLAAWQF